MYEILLERVINRIAAILVERAENQLKQKTIELRHKLRRSPAEISKRISKHDEFIQDWAQSVFIDTMVNPKSVADIFVNLHVRRGRRRDDLSERSDDELAEHRLQVDELRMDRHALIFGEVGSGKTTTLQYLARSLQADGRNHACIVILLRELNQGNSLFDILGEVLGVEIEEDQQRAEYAKQGYGFNQRFMQHARTKIISEILAALKATVILDGFDEIPLQERPLASTQIEALVLGAKSTAADDKAPDFGDNSQEVYPQEASGGGIQHAEGNLPLGSGYEYSVIVTSRPGEFEKKVARVDTYDLLPLSEDQRNRLAANWLGEERAAAFWLEIESKNYKDMADKPLMLTILCNIFDAEHKLPPQQKVIYKKAINFYIEEWDRTRGIDRATRYARLSSEMKFEFLSAFAFNIIDLTNTARPTFDSRLARMIYDKIRARFGLPGQEAIEVIEDIESTTGVIRRIGYDKYEFAHKSLQEYLAGDYLSRLGDLSRVRVNLWSFPNELAVAVALSADPNQRFLELGGFFEGRFGGGTGFAEPFLRRLMAENPGFGRDVLVASWFAYLLRNVDEREAANLFQAFIKDDEQRKAMRDLLKDGDRAIERHRLSLNINLNHKASTIPSYLASLLE